MTLNADMSLLFLLLVYPNLFHFGQGLVNCNKTVSEIQLCTLVSDYDQGMPDSSVHCPDGCPLPDGQPTQIKTSVTLFSVAEFNDDQNTMTLKILLFTWWNDTRLSLTPEGPGV